MNRTTTAAWAIALGMTATSPALASPGFDFVCYDRGFGATIGFDLAWETAYLTTPEGEFELAAQGGDRQSGAFAFSDGSYSFDGFAPEGALRRGDQVLARCHQSRDSLTAIALYGKEGYRWSEFSAPGQGSGNVRARPSLQSEKVASLEDRQPVTIEKNTGEFMDGFFWFRVDYGGGEKGYIWGALLCTDADEPELNTVLRACS